jgi:biopolymer transport protein ExbB
VTITKFFGPGGIFELGGIAMWPLALLSVLSIATILERLWFWVRILSKERETIDRVLDASTANQWDQAAQFARNERDKPIGRFLYAPLKRENLNPESFKLALEAEAAEELHAMRRGEKTLQAIIALAPLLGLLGTVLGLIQSLDKIKLTDIGSNVTLGISQSLIATATGMVIAITSLAFYWVFQGLLFNQVNLFRRSGNELELLYREKYLQSTQPPSEVEEAELL